MTDYATLLRDLLTLNVCCVDHRSSFPARLRSPVADGRLHLPFSPLATKFPYPFFRRFGKIRQQYLRVNHRFAEERTSPLKCEKGQDKEKIALPSLQSAAKKGQDRVILIGSAQEKAAIWKSWPAKVSKKSHASPNRLGRPMAYLDHSHFYLWDREWGGSVWRIPLLGWRFRQPATGRAVGALLHPPMLHGKPPTTYDDFSVKD